MADIIIRNTSNVLPDGYEAWRNEIETRIERAKLQIALKVNSELLSLYWSIGKDILEKQRELGWGAQVISQLSQDLSHRFPDDRGYSERNLRNMKRFAQEYPQFPIWQVPLAEFENYPIWQVALAKLQEEGKDFVQVPLAQITWYHHISLIPKVKNMAERALYIMATVYEGWSRDTMLTQIANGYIEAKGSAINNFDLTLPSPQSDLAKYTFKDPFKYMTKN